MARHKTNDLPLYDLAIRAGCAFVLAGAMATGALVFACEIVKFARTLNG